MQNESIHKLDLSCQLRQEVQCIITLGDNVIGISEVFSCRTYLQYGTVIALHTCVISWTLNLMLKSMKKTRLINNDCSFSRDWK